MHKALFMAAALASAGIPAPAFADILVARVDLSMQLMTVSMDGQVIYSWPVSTARRGYVTPRGSWRPKRLERMWYSSKYEDSADAVLGLLLWRICDPRHRVGEATWPPGFARVRATAGPQCSAVLFAGRGSGYTEHPDRCCKLDWAATTIFRFVWLWRMRKYTDRLPQQPSLCCGIVSVHFQNSG